MTEPSLEPDGRRRPPGLFWIVLAVVAVLVAAGAAAILMGGDNDSVIAPWEARLGDLEAASSQWTMRLTELDRQVDELRSRVRGADADRKAIAANAERLEALERTIATLAPSRSLVELRGDVDAMGANLAARIERLVDDVASVPASAPVAEAAPEPALPFRLVSVDLWDGVAYAGLEHDGRIELVRPGGRIAGWTVATVDHAQGRVVFQNEAGATMERSLPGSASWAQ